MYLSVRYIVFIVLICLISTASSDDFDTVYKRMYNSALAQVSQDDYKELLKLLQPDGSFSDLKYGKDGPDAYHEHGQRQGALAYHNLKGDKDLSSEIRSCFHYITYDAPPNPASDNFAQHIYTPSGMWRGLVLSISLLTKKLVTDFLDRYWVNTKAGKVWNATDNEGSNAGGNFAPRGVFGEVEGLIRGTYKEVHKEVAAHVYKEVVLKEAYDGNGLRPDGCLDQHNPGGGRDTVDDLFLNHTLWNPYNGAYGSEFMQYTSMLMSWYSGTDMDFENASVEGIYGSYFDCQQWVFRGQIIEPTLVGRKINKGQDITYFSTEGLIQKTGENLLAIGRYKEKVEAVLHRYENTVPDQKYALVGHKHFYNTDLSTHQRREYYASVRILSNRTVRPESWETGENIQGYFEADGFMTILVDGEEYGHKHNEVFQVYDWARIPSVTNRYTTNIPGFRLNSYNSPHFFNNAKFSGGVTDDLIGVASMVYNRPHVPVKALKSWFFFEDVFLVLGSGITLDPHSANSEYVGTTLTQIVFQGQFHVCKDTGEEEELHKGDFTYTNPSWVSHRHVSYVFLNGDERFHASAETRTQNNKELDVFMAWITHGKDPVDATLAYAVLPATTLQATRDFVKHPTVEVIAKEKNKHVACYHPSAAIGVSLVDGGKVTVNSCGGFGPVEIDAGSPCLILATIEKKGSDGVTVSVSISDPQQLYDSIDLKVSFKGHSVHKNIDLPKDPNRGSSVTTAFEF